MGRSYISYNEIERELTKALHEPNQWRAVRRMKEASKTMLWKYRDFVVGAIEGFDEGIYTLEKLLDVIKTSYTYWVTEYLPSDELIYDEIYGEEE